jgi:hypothetical protein
MTGDTMTEPRDPELDPDVPNEPVPAEPEVGETDTEDDGSTQSQGDPA